jgi:hypothetical protein
MLDLVVDRREMKTVIANALRFMGAVPQPPPLVAPVPDEQASAITEPAPQG